MSILTKPWSPTPTPHALLHYSGFERVANLSSQAPCATGLGSLPNWIPSLPRKSGCFCGLEHEAIGFLPRNNRHLQVWSLSLLRSKAQRRRSGCHKDVVHLTHPLLLPKSSRGEPLPCGKVNAFDPRAQARWDCWVGRRCNRNPKTASIHTTRKNRTGSAAALSTTSSTFEESHRGRCSCQEPRHYS